MDCSPLTTSVHGILQTRLEWVVIPFSREPSWPRGWTWVFCIEDRFFNNRATGEAPFHCSMGTDNQRMIIAGFIYTWSHDLKCMSFLFNLTFNWRIITLQYCDCFCHTSVWIRYRRRRGHMYIKQYVFFKRLYSVGVQDFGGRKIDFNSLVFTLYIYLIICIFPFFYKPLCWGLTFNRSQWGSSSVT